MSRLAVISSITFLILISLSSSAFAQVEVGNGGDAIRCRPSSDNALDGVYVFDYVVNYDSVGGDSYILDPSGDHVSRILRNLEEKIPGLHESLKGFVSAFEAQVDRQPDFLSHYIWYSAGLGIAEDSDYWQKFHDIWDEDVIANVPANCYRDDQELDIQQLVNRTERTDSIIYVYDQQLWNELRSKTHQKAYLILHEWLWNYAPDARVIRDVSKFLLSESPHKMTAVELSRALYNLGLKDFGVNDALFMVLESGFDTLKKTLLPRLKSCGIEQNAPRWVTDWVDRRHSYLNQLFSSLDFGYFMVSSPHDRAVDQICFHHTARRDGYFINICELVVTSKQDAIRQTLIDLLGVIEPNFNLAQRKELAGYISLSDANRCR